MKNHICVESKTCRCYLYALEPNDNCPIHMGGGIPRCEVCGRFLKRPTNTIVVPSWPGIEDRAKRIHNHMMSNPETAYEVLKNAMLRTHIEAEKGILSIRYIPMNEVVLLENAVIINHRGGDEDSSNK